MNTDPTASSSGAEFHRLGTGWQHWLSRLSMGVLLFETISGLAITLSPFRAAVEWGVLVHTMAGALLLLPMGWYCCRHVADYKTYAASHITVMGWLAVLGLVAATISGVVLAWTAVLGISTEAVWRTTHLVSTLVMLTGVVPHVIAVILKQRRTELLPGVTGYFVQGLGYCALGALVWVGFSIGYEPPKYNNKFPADYSYLYGTNRPFAPSLAKTTTGGAFDSRSLSGSMSCGTVGCHEQITKEWEPSAHRYAAMDTVFQGIQTVMAKQNGPESTRYCGGCHDPISLFSGTKNLFVENLTGLTGYQ